MATSTSKDLTISREHRDQLCRELNDEVYGWTNLSILKLSPSRERDLRDSLRFLDDLRDDREVYTFTAPGEVVDRVVRRLEAFCEDGLRGARQDLLSPPDPSWTGAENDELWASARRWADDELDALSSACRAARRAAIDEAL